MRLEITDELFRIIYIYNAQEDTVILQKFEHRDKVYN